MGASGPLGDKRLYARYQRLPSHEKKKVDNLQQKVGELRSLASDMSECRFVQAAQRLEQEIVNLLKGPYFSTFIIKTQRVGNRILNHTPETLKKEAASLRDHLVAERLPEKFCLGLARLYEIASELKGLGAQDVKRVMYDTIHQRATRIRGKRVRHAFRQVLLDCYLSKEDQVACAIDKLPDTGAKVRDLKAIVKQYPFLSVNERLEAYAKLTSKMGKEAAQPYTPNRKREMATPHSLQDLMEVVNKKRKEVAGLVGELDQALKSMEEVHLIAIEHFTNLVAKAKDLKIVPAHRYLGHIKEHIMALPVEHRAEACRGARLICQHQSMLNYAFTALEAALEEQSHEYRVMSLEGLKARLGSTGEQGISEVLRDPKLLAAFEDTLRKSILDGNPDPELIELTEHIEGQDVISKRIQAMCELVHRLELTPRVRSESFADQLARLQDVFTARKGIAPNYFVLENMEGVCALFLAGEFPIANMSANPDYGRVEAMLGEPLASMYLHMKTRIESGDGVPAASYSRLSRLMGERLKLQADQLKTITMQNLPRESKGVVYEMRLAVAKKLEADITSMSLHELEEYGQNLVDLQYQVEGLVAFEKGLEGLEGSVREILKEHLNEELSGEGCLLIKQCLEQYHTHMELALSEGKSIFLAEGPTELNMAPIAAEFADFSVSKQTAALVAMQLVSDTLHQIHADGGLVGGRLPRLTAARIAEVVAAKKAQGVALNRKAARSGRNEKED